MWYTEPKTTDMLSQKLWNGCWQLILDCTLWYTSCKLCWAPSLPEPIAFASNWTNVPDGSMWKSWGPFSSQPANKIATPKGRLWNQTRNLLTTHKWQWVKWKLLKCVCVCVDAWGVDWDPKVCSCRQSKSSVWVGLEACTVYGTSGNTAFTMSSKACKGGCSIGSKHEGGKTFCEPLCG